MKLTGNRRWKSETCLTDFLQTAHPLEAKFRILLEESAKLKAEIEAAQKTLQLYQQIFVRLHQSGAMYR